MQLSLAVNTQGWAAFKRRRSDKAFRRQSDAVLRRFDHQCLYCGFRARYFQQVINIDGNYQRNESDNLACACILCTQCHFIGAQNFGRIIYLPEFSQAELNQLVRVLFASMLIDDALSASAKVIYRSLRHRGQKTESIFGQETSESTVFGQCLADIDYETKPNTYEVMSSLKLLPYRSPIEKPIKYWSSIIKPQFDAKGILQHMV